MKCLCKRPDYVRVPDGHWHKTILLNWNDDIILHGKKATGTCYRCGVPLCDRCAEFIVEDDDYGLPSTSYYLCPDCAEEL